LIFALPPVEGGGKVEKVRRGKNTSLKKLKKKAQCGFQKAIEDSGKHGKGDQKS